jgi:hypothetical protein
LIRRDAKLADGTAAWLLISQIEHARISAQLAAHCTGRFGAGNVAEDIRREVLASIEHHDDGWAEWEIAPRIDADGRPASFMELEPAESVAIWTRSIAAAEEYGPLAAWMVAGHFARLMGKSEHAALDRHAKAWQEGVKVLRGAALSQWQAANPTFRTEELAEEALQWLWSFDELSLWFCCTCPSVGERPKSLGLRDKLAGQGAPIEMQLQASGNGLAGAAPWRFNAASIDIEAAARIVPVERYATADALLAACQPQTLRWQFMAPIEHHLA